MRQVFVSDHRSVLALASTYAQTADFLADLKLRAVIEWLTSVLAAQVQVSPTWCATTTAVTPGGAARPTAIFRPNLP